MVMSNQLEKVSGSCDSISGQDIASTSQSETAYFSWCLQVE